MFARLRRRLPWNRPRVQCENSMWWQDAVDELRNTVGIGTCPICGAYADAEHSSLAVGGKARAGCPNGHHWNAELA